MASRRPLLGPVAAAVTLAAATLAGCGSTASEVVNKATSAVSQAASSASSAASSAMAAVKDAVTATSDVQVGPVSTDADGRTVATLTVTNPTADTHDYTISVSFQDNAGNLLDVAVVSVKGVAGHASATATARSNRTLTGAASAKVTAALRH